MRREYWHLTEGLIFIHFAVFLLTRADPAGAGFLVLIPGQVALRPWTLVTYQFIHPEGLLWFFLSMLVLWIMARPLEESWGSPRFAAFWAVAIFGAAGAALAIGVPLAGDIFLAASLLFTFATLYPDTEFLLFFILPVKVKYLAVVAAAFLVWSSLGMGLMRGAVNLVGMSAGYLFFLLTRRLPTRRKLAFQLKQAKADLERRMDTSAAEQRNRGFDLEVRAAEARARELGTITDEDRSLLERLDAARDESITVCAPEDFGYTDDQVCRSCPGYAECAARRIRMAAEEGAARGGQAVERATGT